ncbi:STAS domain-containing protein [Terasakiella pusilla]|uniref:STAS domain-containing protein n=1 Tax=Terasakiella pusilla TaxID=64973 RepID=UPI003AA88107
MKYSLQESDSVVTVQLTGELTVTDEEEFRLLSQKAIETSGAKCIVDVTKLDFLDSAGLGLILVLKEMCEELGKTVTLRIGQSPVRDIMEISEFDSLIPYEDA